MTFDLKKIEYSKRHINIVEIELDKCTLTHGIAPCKATETGDDKCFNTFGTCNDLVNYTVGADTGLVRIDVNDAANTFTLNTGNFVDLGFKVGDEFTSSNFFFANNNGVFKIISLTPSDTITILPATLDNEVGSGGERIVSIRTNNTQTYRMCENVSPHPIGLDAIPCLKGNPSISPAKIDLKGGLGVRANVSLNFSDLPSSDIGIDPYLSDRTYDPLDRSSFWVKLRARNANYQNRTLKLLSGYLNDDGSYDVANFQTRTYLIDKLNASGGQCSITGKDPLKLASNNKAQAPAPSTGLLSIGISSAALSANLIPAGVGNDEYETSGFILINSEVIAFTRVADALTLTRSQYNTKATIHAANDTVQQCLEYSGATRGKLDFISNDLLTNFANVSTSFIPTADWDSEVSTHLSGLLDAIIVKPMDVNKLLKELAESMPHYLWWDERSNKIQLTALKAPPLSADVLDMDENLIKNSVRVTDKPEMRLSTIFVNFGQFDPTKKLDEPSNYQQTYVRVDTDSIAKYGSSQVKQINSRWINNLNKASALQLAALIGRRFADTPREISFSLEAKDSDVWIGQSKDINHRDMVDQSGLKIDTTFQLTSVKESDNYSYTGLEFTYGGELPEDEGGGDPDVDLIIIGSSIKDINLRTIFDGLFPAPDATTQANFIIQNGVVIGSTSTGTAGLDTGSWPAGATVTLQTDSGGFSVGMGGTGADGDGTPVATDGGDAIEMNHDLEIINNGVIGGGGGGGGSNVTIVAGTGNAAGGGGAGCDVGSGGTSSFVGDDLILLTHGGAGTLESGGTRGQVKWNTSEPETSNGAVGGDLGQNGVSSDTAGGTAGLAIKKNGYTLTQTVSGDIRGSIT